MNEQLLVNVTPFETRVALLEQGALQELHIERHRQRSTVGNIYLGKILRILPGMQCAFVDIGLDKAGFLHVGDLRETREARLNGKPQPPIEKCFFDGQTVIVQITKDAVGNKGYRLTNRISIAGRMMVYLPFDQTVGVSQKIEDPEERERLKAQLLSLTTQGQAPEKGGYILRTQAESASLEEMQNDLAYLQLCWQHVQKQWQRLPAPSLIYQELALAERVMRDLVTPQTHSVTLDSRTAFQHLQQWAQLYTPALYDKLRHHQGSRPLFDTAHIDQAIQDALSRRVPLPSGGYIIIDQTEALTAIDVNTGSFVGQRNFQDTIFKTNLEAAVAIARQLRLRNLGGIVIIDFIDMRTPEHQQAVLDKLQAALSKDRIRTQVNGFTALGLVELTRKRERASLASLLTEPCPTCDQRGHVRTPQTMAYTIMREILREAKQFDPKEFRLILSPALVDIFLDEESPYLAMLEAFIGKPITLEVNNTYSQEEYDIVLK